MANTKILKKPTQKTFTKSAVTVMAVALGAMLSDGVITVIPQNYQKYAKGLVSLAGLSIAAATTKAEVMLAGVGLSAIQVVSLIRESSKTVKTSSPFLAATLGIDANTTSGGKSYNIGMGNPNPFLKNIDWDAAGVEEANVVDADTIEFM